LAQERGARFDLAHPPLIRFALVRVRAQEHRLVLTNHHLVTDGWSIPVLVQELLALYGSNYGSKDASPGGDASVLARVTPYRDYLAWVAAQDRAAAVAAWREALHGLSEATLLAPPDHGRSPVVPEQHTLALSEKLTLALTDAARRQGLTLNTLVQVAWAILLG